MQVRSRSEAGRRALEDIIFHEHNFELAIYKIIFPDSIVLI